MDSLAEAGSTEDAQKGGHSGVWTYFYKIQINLGLYICQRAVLSSWKLIISLSVGKWNSTSVTVAHNYFQCSWEALTTHWGDSAKSVSALLLLFLLHLKTVSWGTPGAWSSESYSELDSFLCQQTSFQPRKIFCCPWTVNLWKGIAQLSVCISPLLKSLRLSADLLARTTVSYLLSTLFVLFCLQLCYNWNRLWV